MALGEMPKFCLVLYVHVQSLQIRGWPKANRSLANPSVVGSYALVGIFGIDKSNQVIAILRLCGFFVKKWDLIYGSLFLHLI
jgi:hypothetical protein